MRGNACDGWEPIRLSGASAKYLVAHDISAAKDVLTHNEHGETVGCWKAGR